MTTKPRVAFFDFACCEGCQLSAIDLEPEQLLDLLELIEIVEFREAISEQSDQYDVAIIEGSITRDSDIPRLKKIRERAKILITLGACSTIAGINALKNFQIPAEYKKEVYDSDPDKYETTIARAVDEFVQVDAFIPGCPIDTNEFIRVVKNLVLGKKPDIPTYPVCVECKRNENICVYEKGIQCLGPVTRAGCNARCPGAGGYCFGCRGVVPNPSPKMLYKILSNKSKRYNLDVDEMEKRFKLFLGRNEEVLTDDK